VTCESEKLLFAKAGRGDGVPELGGGQHLAAFLRDDAEPPRKRSESWGIYHIAGDPVILAYLLQLRKKNGPQYKEYPVTLAVVIEGVVDFLLRGVGEGTSSCGSCSWR